MVGTQHNRDQGSTEGHTGQVQADEAALRRGLWLRRGFLSLLGLLVLAGLFDLLGVRSATAQAQAPGGGPTLSVEYPEVARAGLDVPLEVRVAGATPGQRITLGITGAYLSVFDRSTVDPRPIDEQSRGDLVVWTFTMPPSGALDVAIDAQVQRSRHFGQRGDFQLLDDQGDALTTVSVHTWLAP